MFVTQRSITRTEVNHSYKQYYGFYFTYWKLYAQLIKMLSSKSDMFQQIRNHIKEAEKLFGLKLENKVKREYRKQLLYWYSIGFIWSCFIKPLKGLYHTKTSFQGVFEIVDGEFYNKSVNKTTTYYLFRFPIAFASHRKLRAEDIEKLTK